MTTLVPIIQDRLNQAKWAFSVRRVPRGDAVSLSDDLERASAGDLVLGRVERIGSHKKIQLAQGRSSELYLGDLVVLACGDRYASDQFEGIAELDPRGADMLASGGVLGRMRCRHARMSAPTQLVPLGLLADGAGRVVNLSGYALAPIERPKSLPAICVVGSAMNSGKTTTGASLAHGLTRAGHRVAAVKATGTGAFGDFNAYLDAGASYVSDFTDVGMVSTYRQPLARIEAGLETLLAHAAANDCHVAIVELADGVVQKETADLLRNFHQREGFAGALFAASDSLSAAGGSAALRSIGIEPVALTGVVSCSPLGTLEAEAATGLQVVTREALCDPALASALLAQMEARVSSRMKAAKVAAVRSAA